MKVLIGSLTARVQRLSPLTVGGIGLGYMLGVCLADYATPVGTTFALFYLLGVSFMAWGAGRGPGILAAVVASGLGSAVEWVVVRPTLGTSMLLWNGFSRLVLYLAIAWLVAEVTQLTRHLERVVEERTAQWKTEAEKHRATSARLTEIIERFEQVINNIAEVFWLTDIPKDRMIYISPGYERIWGRKCADLYREPRAWLAAVHPADRAEVLRRAQTEQASGTYDVEYRILRPDGSVRWIRDRGFPVRNQQGEVYRVAGIADDITERKKTRETLQTQATILENMAEGVLVTDEMGVIQQMNPAAERIWGYQRNEMVGRPVSMLSTFPAPEATANMRKVLVALQTTGTWRRTFNNRRKDGKIITCEAHISRVEMQGRVSYIAVEQDVTDRQRAEAALRQSEDNLWAFMAALPTPACLLDQTGKIIVANRTMGSRLGVPEDELPGKDMFRLLPGNVNAERKAVFEENLHTRRPIQFEDERAGHHYFNLTSPVFDGAGNVSRVAVIAFDITERKRTELMKEALLSLGGKLSAARSSVEVARAVYAAADQLWQWDSATLSLYSPDSDRAEPVLFCDVVEGKRCEVVPSLPAGAPTARMRRIMSQGGELMLHQAGDPPPVDVFRFGDLSRVSASVMCVPLHRDDQPVGMLSIQSYAANAYTPDDLLTLQALADYCGGALERIRAEKARQKSEELNRTILDTTMDGFHAVEVSPDRLGVISDVNEAYSRMTGYSREELLQLRIFDLEAKESPEETARHLARIVSMRGDSFETRLRRKDGREIQVEISASSLAVDDPRVFGFVRDITERKRADRAKEALLSLGARLNETEDPRAAARAVLAAADQLWKWDAAVLQVYSPERDCLDSVLLVDLVDGERREVPPPYPDSPPPPIMRRIMQNGPELILRTAADMQGNEFVAFGDMERLSASLMYVPLRREGRTVGVLSIQSYAHNAYTPDDLQTLQALTDYCGGALERLRATALLRDANDTLERRIQERTAELQTANAALRQAHDQLEQRVNERTAELQAANKALAESEERYRSLVNNLNVGVYRNTPGSRGKFLQVNPALAKMQGYDSVEEFQKLNVADTYQDPGERLKLVARLMREGAVADYEVRLKKKDGTHMHASVSATVHRGADGAVDWIDGVLEDITDRKLAREALQASEERYRALAESSPDVIFILDRDHRVRYANAAAAGLWNCQPANLIGQPLRELHPSKVGLGHAQAVEGVFTTGQPAHREVLDSYPAGKRWIAIHLVPLFGDDQIVGSVMGVCRDVTDRKNAEQQLIDALDLNERMLAAATMGIGAYKASGECIFVNEALAKAVGGTVRELLQDNFRGMEGWKKTGLLSLAEAALNHPQPQSREVHGLTHYGKCAWLDCHLTRFVSGGQPHLLVMVQDITERRRTEEALRLAESRQEAILDNIPDPAWLKDSKGLYLACNEAFARFYGQRIETVTGKTIGEFAPQEADRAAREDAKVRRTRKTLRSEMSFIGAEGQVQWFESIKAPIFNQHDKIIGTVGIARDITERKRTEILLRAQRDLGVSFSLTTDLTVALEKLIELAIQIGGLDSGAVYLLNSATGGMDVAVHRGRSPDFVKAVSHWASDSPQMRLIRRGKPIFTLYRDLPIDHDTARTREGLQAIALVPLCHEKTALGALAVSSNVNDNIPLQTRIVIEAIAAQAAGAIARIQAENERSRLERQVLDISDRQQAHIGQDIHDGLCQQLVGVAFDATLLHRELSRYRHPQAKTARRIINYLDQAITESRQLSRGLFPVRLESEGLPPALRELAKATCRRFKVRCRFSCQGDGAVGDTVMATHLYRIAQEAVANAIKHSHARSIFIRLRTCADRIELAIEDNGSGLASAARAKAMGMGLHMMAYRARSIGGTLRLSRGRRGGTLVSCCVPRHRS
ncbi:MAG TPA: PAS domain S-box protein [Candidatus Paceibacterota bacterium]|nr:PAS domain S-box protein [Verrucomicrobiota bacterium]HSA11260.1 PAS domain S-box protein [Candidatus Paceibacterota bacterium]